MPSRKFVSILGAFAAITLSAPALAQNADEAPEGPPSDAMTNAAQSAEGPPAGPFGEDSVFDDTWLTVGLGASITPSYSGSDDYVFFPVPLLVGRVGGVGIAPSAAGITLDLLSKPPSGPQQGASFALGPTFRFRNDRADQIEDEVVRAAGELDRAIEIGVSGGVTIPAMIHSFDSLTLSTAVRWDVAGAHSGMLIEPSITYFTPLNRGTALQISAGASISDDSFAQYYYDVSPAQSAASGLPLFTADGGLNSFGTNALLAVDLDGNAMNGGLGIFAIGGYSRLVGDAKNTPYTSVRGSADQFFGALGLAYTF